MTKLHFIGYMPRLNKILFCILILLSVALPCAKSYALSEYGLRCEDNKKCIACKNDVKCIKCLHKCRNFYGPADTNIRQSKLSKAEACSQTRAKWCSAQCWDTDDVKDPAYVTTKPKCDDKEFYFPPGGTRHEEGVTR